MHPKWQQKKLREACAKFNVQVCAYSPLGAPLMPWGSPAILDNPIIKEVAQKHGKTPAQVSYLHKLPKSSLLNISIKQTSLDFHSQQVSGIS